MIQDIFPMHLSNEYHKKVPQADSFLMIFKDNRILAKNDGQVCYLTYKELSEICRGKMCIRDRGVGLCRK